MKEPISIDQFLADTINDLRSPQETDFLKLIPTLRNCVSEFEVNLDYDRNLITKTKKVVKNLVNTGNSHTQNSVLLCDELERLGQLALEGEEACGNDIAAGLSKFSVIHRELSNMFSNLMRNLNSVVVYPMEAFIIGDMKLDLKKNFEKAYREYETKFEKTKKEKIQLMKESGAVLPDAYNKEMAAELVRERRKIQYELCDYLLRVNEIKSKKGADFFQYLIDFYHAQLHYFKECLSVLEHFGKSMDDLTARASVMHKRHDLQKRKLLDTKEDLKRLITENYSSGTISVQSIPLSTPNVTISQKKYFGMSKSGYLWKQSEGKVKKVWQRRKVVLADGQFHLHHADENKTPTKLNLITCQMKIPGNEHSSDISSATQNLSNSSTHNLNYVFNALQSNTIANSANIDDSPSGLKRSFHLVSYNRTYHFQADDDHEFEEWTGVLNNAMQAAFSDAMNNNSTDNPTGPMSPNNHTNDASSNDSVLNASQRKLQASENQYYDILSNVGQSQSSLQNNETFSSLQRSMSFSSQSNLSNSGNVNFYNATTMNNQTPYISSPNPMKQNSNHYLHCRDGLIAAVRYNIPGNQKCADCYSNNASWVSINLGIVLCLDCCGVHRALGVHLSRTQSLDIDDLTVNQLMIPRFIGNETFNRVYEANLNGFRKVFQNSVQRQIFIRNKYLRRVYLDEETREQSQIIESSEFCSDNSLSEVKVDCDGDLLAVKSVGPADNLDPSKVLSPLTSVHFLLIDAVVNSNIENLLKVHSCKFNLNNPLPNIDPADFVHLNGSIENVEKLLRPGWTTAAHLALDLLHNILSKGQPISNEDQITFSRTIYIIHFIINNSTEERLSRLDSDGNTILHYVIKMNYLFGLKIFLNTTPVPTPLLFLKNASGQTPLEYAYELYEPTTDLRYIDLTTDDNDKYLEELKPGESLIDLVQYVQCLVSDESLMDRYKRKLQDLILNQDHLDFGIHKASISSGTFYHQVEYEKSKPYENVDHAQNESDLHIWPHYSTRKQYQSIPASTLALASVTLPRKAKGPAPRPPVSSEHEDHSNLYTLQHKMKNELHSNSIRNGLSTPLSTLGQKIASFNPFANNAVNGVDIKKGKKIKLTKRSISLRNNFSTLPTRRNKKTSKDEEIAFEKNHLTDDIEEDLKNLSNLFPYNTQMDNNHSIHDISNGQIFMSNHRINVQQKSYTNLNKIKTPDNIEVILDVLDNQENLFHYPTIAGTTPTLNQSLNMKTIQTNSLYSNYTLNNHHHQSRDAYSHTSDNGQNRFSKKRNKSVDFLMDIMRNQDIPSIDAFDEDDKMAETTVDDSTISADRSAEKLYKPGNYSRQDLILTSHVKAIYSCDAEHNDELSFDVGEVIRVIDRPEEEWWLGVIEKDESRSGLFPVPYVVPFQTD